MNTLSLPAKATCTHGGINTTPMMNTLSLPAKAICYMGVVLKPYVIYLFPWWIPYPFPDSQWDHVIVVEPIKCLVRFNSYFHWSHSLVMKKCMALKSRRIYSWNTSQFCRKLAKLGQERPITSVNLWSFSITPRGINNSFSKLPVNGKIMKVN
jgi:hypothetical protein